MMRCPFRAERRLLDAVIMLENRKLALGESIPKGCGIVHAGSQEVSTVRTEDCFNCRPWNH